MKAGRSPSVSHEYITETMYELRAQGRTLAEVGRLFGVTRQGVNAALKKYEQTHNLTPSVEKKREAKKREKHQVQQQRLASLRTRRIEQRLANGKASPLIQLDAPLVGLFLQEVGHRSLYLTHHSASARKKNGEPYPCAKRPNSVSFTDSEGRVRKVHSWVLDQYHVARSPYEVVVHKDGDICNNLLENLEVISKVEHGKRTMQRQIDQKGSARARMYDDDTVRAIRADYRDGMMVEAMMYKYKTSNTTIWAIATYRRYTDVPD